MILAIFDLQVTPMLPTKLRVNWPFGSGKKRKIDFQDGCYGAHLGFPIRTILAIFVLQVTPMLPTKFRVNRPLGSGKEAKNRFSRWLSWRPFWISYQNNFSYFLSTNNPDASFELIGLLVQEKGKIVFQDCHHGSHLGFLIGTIGAIFDLQVTPMLPTKCLLAFWFRKRREK